VPPVVQASLTENMKLPSALPCRTCTVPSHAARPSPPLDPPYPRRTVQCIYSKHDHFGTILPIMASQSDFLVRVASVLGNQRITIPLAADVASLRSEIVKQYGASCRPADVYLSPNRTALSAAYSFAEDLFGANDSIVSELCKRGFQLYAQFPPRSFPKPSEPARSRLHTKASEPQGPLVRKATFKS